MLLDLRRLFKRRKKKEMEFNYELFCSIASLTQATLKTTLENCLENFYSNIIKTDKYIVGVGDIPVGLVAHMDTVFRNPPKNIYFDREKSTIWSPDGLGADDRAGIYAILEILQQGFLPTVIFTTDEERGALGAASLAKSGNPVEGLKFLIELDRQGKDDCVFYECDNEEFHSYIETFNFKTQYGSFSDISLLCPCWNLCGVNLSVGYFDEHSYVERLNTKYLLDTIQKVIDILKQETYPTFEYITYNTEYKCSVCKMPFSEYELFPVKSRQEKKKFIYYCPDCMTNRVEWCDICGQPYEIYGNKRKICRDCKEKINK